MVEDGIFAIKFDGFGEFEAGFLVIFEFVINDAKSVVNGWELGVVFKKLIEAIKSLFVFGLSFIVKAQIIQTINVFRLNLQGHQVVSLFLWVHVYFLIAHGSVVVKFIVSCFISKFTWIYLYCFAIIRGCRFVLL